jgi:hypothetical protein
MTADTCMSTSASKLMDRVLLLGLTLFAVAAGVIGIRRPMLIDEAGSVIISSYDLPGVFSHLRLDNSQADSVNLDNLQPFTATVGHRPCCQRRPRR